MTPEIGSISLSEALNNGKKMLNQTGVGYLVTTANEQHVGNISQSGLFPSLVSDKPLWLLQNMEKAALTMVKHYFTLMSKIPSTAVSVDGLIPWLATNGKKLELSDYQIQKAGEPLLIRGDVVLNGNSEANFVLVDPNLVPMGLPNMLAINDTFGYGVADFNTFLEAFDWQLEATGEPKSLQVALVTSPGYVAVKGHHFMAEKLTNAGYKVMVVSPAEMTVDDGQVFTKGEKVDVIWNYIRGIAKYCPAVYDLYLKGSIGMINPPGIRLAETQAWFALLKLPSICKGFEGNGCYPDTWPIGLVPKTYIVKAAGNNLKICTDWQNGMPVFDGGFSDMFTEGDFDGQKQLVFLKTFDTSGSKGVEVSSCNQKKMYEKITKWPFNGLALVEKLVIPKKTESGDTKFEVYAVHTKEGWKIVSVGLMSRSHADVLGYKVHGSSNTIESLVEVSDD